MGLKKKVLIIGTTFLFLSSLVAALVLVRQRQESRKEAGGGSISWCVGNHYDSACGDSSPTFYSHQGDSSDKVPCSTYQWDDNNIGEFKVKTMGPDPYNQKCANGWNQSQGFYENCDGGSHPDDFDWASCASCQNLVIKNYSTDSGTITATVKGWTIRPGVEDGEISADNTDLDFKVEVKKDGNIIAEQGDIDGMNDCDDNPNCQMINYECHRESQSGYNEPRDKVVICTIEIKFTNINFQQGSTYLVKAYNRLGSQYDYRQPGYVCDRYSSIEEYSWCNDNPICTKTISMALECGETGCSITDNDCIDSKCIGWMYGTVCAKDERQDACTMQPNYENCCTAPTATPTLTNTPTPTPTPTLTNTPTPTPTPPLECNDYCDIFLNNCPSGLECYSLTPYNHRCRNPECLEESSCVCPGITPTNTPTPTKALQCSEEGQISVNTTGTKTQIRVQASIGYTNVEIRVTDEEGTVNSYQNPEVTGGYVWTWLVPINYLDIRGVEFYVGVTNPGENGEYCGDWKPEPTPTPTITPTPVYECDCDNVAIYDQNWILITDYENLIDKDIYIAVEGTTDHPDGLTKARFRIDNSEWVETEQENGNRFYISYKFTTYGEHTIEAEVYNSAFGWR